VAQGTPEQVARVRKSYTGEVLARVLNGAGRENGGESVERNGAAGFAGAIIASG
jgi:hypothetical protein